MEVCDQKHVGSIRELQVALPQTLARLQARQLPPRTLQNLEQHLKEAVTVHLRECPRICFLGRTGSGKTSLMNAILGVDLLPAMESGEAVTSAVTELQNDPTMSEGSIRIVRETLTEVEWSDLKQLLVEIMGGGFADLGSHAELKMQRIATAVLAEACPNIPTEEVTVESPISENFSRLLSGSPEQVSFDSVAGASDWLRDHVDLAHSKDITASILTRTVRIAGRFPNIPRDVLLVDLPGLEDSNILRRLTAERYFALSCTHAWFCLPRADNRILSNMGIARQVRTLARGSRLANVLLVRTRADEALRKPEVALQREMTEFRELCTHELEELGENSDFILDAGYVLTTVAPAAEGMEADVQIRPALQVLQQIDQRQRESAHTFITSLFQHINEEVKDPQLLQAASELHEIVGNARVRVQAFRAAMSRSDDKRVTEALVHELHCAKPSKTLQALIASQGIWNSHSSNRTFNLPETFLSTLRPDDQSLAVVFRSLVAFPVRSLETVAGVPIDFLESIKIRANKTLQQINAIGTIGGPVHDLLRQALRWPWPGGRGSSHIAIEYANEKLSRDNGTARAIQGITDLLCGSLDSLLQWIESQGTLCLEPAPIAPPTELSMCIVCLDAPAVCRAEFVECNCMPRLPYSCFECVRYVDVSYRMCPMCRHSPQVYRRMTM